MSMSNKGKVFTEEHKRKLSEAAKKRKRRPQVEETKRKIAEKARGRKHSAATRKKISEIQKGGTWSPARRAAYEASKVAK